MHLKFAHAAPSGAIFKVFSVVIPNAPKIRVRSLENVRWL